MVLGHEAGGEITALPSSYKGDLKVGDRVAIEAGVSCSSCSYCKGGRYNLCNVRPLFPYSLSKTIIKFDLLGSLGNVVLLISENVSSSRWHPSRVHASRHLLSPQVSFVGHPSYKPLACSSAHRNVLLQNAS